MGVVDRMRSLDTPTLHTNPTTSPPYKHPNSAVGSGVFLLAAGLSFQQRWPASVLMASLCLFMGFFSLGMGAITFVVASELFPLPVRGKAMALTVFVNRLLRCVSILRAGWLGRASPSQAKASHPPTSPPKKQRRGGAELPEHGAGADVRQHLLPLRALLLRLHRLLRPPPSRDQGP